MLSSDQLESHPQLRASHIPVDHFHQAVKDVVPIALGPLNPPSTDRGILMEFRKSGLALKAANDVSSGQSTIEGVGIFQGTSFVADANQLFNSVRQSDWRGLQEVDITHYPKEVGFGGNRILIGGKYNFTNVCIVEESKDPVSSRYETITNEFDPNEDPIPFSRLQLSKILSLFEDSPLNIEQVRLARMAEEVKFSQKSTNTGLPLEVVVGVDRLFRANVYSGALPIRADAKLLKSIVNASDFKTVWLHFRTLPGAYFSITQDLSTERFVSYTLTNIP